MPRRRNVVRRKLADGSVRTYVYESAGASRTLKPANGTIGWLQAQYEASPEYAALAPASRKLYRHVLKELEAVRYFRLADFQRKHIMAIRDKLAGKPGIANSFVRAVGAMFAWAMQRGIREDYNPAAGIKSLALKERGPWDEADLRRAEAGLSGPMLTAFMLGLYTGQRRGDVLRLTWAAYDGQGFDLRQQKTGKALWVPAVPPLQAYLAALPRTGIHIVCQTNGRPYSTGGFDGSWRLAVARCGVPRGLFHGLRHSAATRLAEAGCSEHEIAAITGHSLAMVRVYTQRARQRAMAEAAVAKLFAPDFARARKTPRNS